MHSHPHFHDDYGPGHHFWRLAARLRGHRHGGGRFGGGGPMGGGIGGMFRAGRMLADGDLRLIALALLEETPRHGYDIIKALEERTAGFYSPSPGVVYPTLTFLEEAGYATSSAEGNKKVFAITEAGKAHLEENRALVEGVLDQMDRFGRKMERAGEWFEGLGRREGKHGSAGALELAKARRRIAMAVADKLDGSEEDRRYAAEVLNRAADSLEGKSTA